MAAYKDGDADQDVGYFYFELGDFYVPADQQPWLDPSDLFTPHEYAALLHLSEAQTGSSPDGSAVRKQVARAVESNHMSFQPDPKAPSHVERYYPVLCQVRELRGGTPIRRLTPLYRAYAHASYFQVTEREEAVLEVSFSAPGAEPPEPGSQIAFKHDDTAFSSSSQAWAVESRYDDRSWLVVPTSTERDIMRELVIETNVSAETGAAVNLNLALPVVITPNKWRRRSFLAVDLGSAAGLAAGTAGVALLGKPGIAALASIVMIAVGYPLYLVLAWSSRLLKS